MGVFSRFKDIVSANLNSMLDRAEDPEKMVRLMIQEMEDTLIEVKSSCAAELASQKKQSRAMHAAREQEAEWDAKARLAVDKGHKETQERIRRIDTTEAFARFEAYENQIDRLQAEGDLVNGLRPKDDLRAQFADLEHADVIERELQDLKKPAAQSGAPEKKKD